MDTANAEIKRLLGASELNKSDAINLMTQLRLCLEADGSKKRFPYLNMYSDWTVHPQLSRSESAYQVIASLADALIKSPNAPNSPGFYDDVTRAFCFDELRADCIAASAHFGTPDNFCRAPEIWPKFLVLLISILLERPLAFPESNVPKKVTALMKGIQSKWEARFKSKNTLGIKGVAFILGTGEHEAKVFWSIQFIPGPTCVPKSVTLRGPLKLSRRK